MSNGLWPLAVVIGIGLPVIAAIVAYAIWRHDRKAPPSDARPVVARCPWCPATPADGAREDATRHDCTCTAPCGQMWCAAEPYIESWNGS